MFDSSRRMTLGASSSAVALAVAAALSAAPARAQQPDNASVRVEEIVVTASKVGEQSLSDVPMAIQAFTGESLASKGIREAKDLIELIPGASEQSEIGAGYKVFSFRGSGAGGPIGDGMIGYYLDDTPFGIPNFQASPPIQYFDLDRIEVLRGPQGTLYGQGSMGGAIIYHTKSPDLSKVKLEGEVGSSKTAEAGDMNYRVAAGVSMPLITDKLAVRLSGGYDYRAGYADVYQGDPVGTPYKTDANNIRSADAQAVISVAADRAPHRAHTGLAVPEQPGLPAGHELRGSAVRGEPGDRRRLRSSQIQLLLEHHHLQVRQGPLHECHGISRIAARRIRCRSWPRALRSARARW